MCFRYIQTAAFQPIKHFIETAYLLVCKCNIIFFKAVSRTQMCKNSRNFDVLQRKSCKDFILIFCAKSKSVHTSVNFNMCFNVISLFI